MAYNELECVGDIGLTGLQECAESFGYWERFIVVPKGQNFSTKEDALLLENWIEKLNNTNSERWLPTPDTAMLEGNQEDTIYEDLIGGNREFIRDGKDSVNIKFKAISMFDHKQLRKLNGRSDLGVFILTSIGYILGYSVDGVVFEPINIDELRFEKRTISDGDTKDRSSMSLVFSDSNEWNNYGVWIKPSSQESNSWIPEDELVGVKAVSISTSNESATELTASVVGASDKVAVIGLVVGDFSLKDSSGATVTITGVTEVGDGSYTLAFGTLTAGDYTLELAQQPTMTTKFFESINTAAFTIV